MFPDWNSDKIESSKDASQIEARRAENVHDSQKKRIISCLYIMSILIYVILMAVLVAISWDLLRQYKLTDQFYYANQVSFDWKKGFITDMTVTTTSDCPAGYEHAFNYEWPGTSFGCYCQVTVNITFVLEGYCTPALIQKNCHNMESNDAVSTHYWKNQSNICVKRSSVSMYTEEKYDENIHKICGSSQSLVIMPNNENCPFVNLTIAPPTLQSNTALIENGTILSNPLYGIFNATSPYSFYTYPINDFKVSEYEFCLISEDTGIDPSHSQFILLNNQRGCATVGNFSTLDSTTEKQFFANNPQLQTLAGIEGFPPPAHWIYNLGFSSNPSWNYACRHNMDGKFSIPNTRNMFNLTFQTQYTSMSIAIAVIIGVIAAEFLVLTIRKIFKSSVYPTGYKQRYLPCDFCKALTQYIIDFSCKLTILGLMLYIAYVSWYNWNWFKSAIQENCADDNPQLFQYILSPYSDLYQKLLQYSLGKVLIGLAFLVIDIAHFVYIYKAELKHYLVESEGKEFILAKEGKEESSREFDLDSINWLRKESEKKDRMFDDVQRENNDFRVTMAYNYNDSLPQENSKKPQIKRQKKPRGFLFKKNNEEQESIPEMEERPRQQMIIRQGNNPYLLEDASISMFMSEFPNMANEEVMKERKRR